jgi:15-cis-phytoene synthase
MTPDAYCRKRTLESKTSFYYPIMLLPAPSRAAMYALYAFCREVDDVVDEEKSLDKARKQLAFWREDLDRAVAHSNPEHPVSIELSLAIQAFALPTSPLYDIIDGMEMDLNQQRYKDQEELTVYCSKVAVAVGLIAVHIFCFGKADNNLDSERKNRFANHLGMAFQLTNILRDIKEDAQRGRIYIPQSLLTAHGVTESQILTGEWNQTLAEALAQLGAEAEHHFQAADAMLEDRAERNCLFPALLMSGIYHRYLTTIEQLKFDTLSQPVKLSSAKKLALTIKIWLKERVFRN